MPEGELAKLRASVVSAATLAEVARRLDLGSSLRLGKGEASSGGRDKSSILADALEAVFGAIYVDGGFEALAPIVLGALADHIVEASDGPGNRDFKTKLQELAARRYEELPAYDVRDEGPDHEKRFFATVRLGGAVKGEGEGTSKKLAEQDAARAAWTALTAELALDPTAPAATSVHDASTEGEPPAVDDVALGDTAPGDINGDTTAAAPTADEDLERKRASADA
jgi:ribonuclease-3